MKYCNQCGSSVVLRIPDDDDRHRYICDSCQIVHYENPRMVVLSLPRAGDRVLMCKRAIEPRYGLWTLPGGFLENGETTQEGARRETWEEAGARVDIRNLYTLYNLPHIDQVQMCFLADLRDEGYAAGKESLEVELLREHEIPWEEIAFPAVSDTLRHYFRDRESGHYPMRVADILVDEYKRRILVPLGGEQHE